jgi:hypothetical protein
MAVKTGFVPINLIGPRSTAGRPGTANAARRLECRQFSCHPSPCKRVRPKRQRSQVVPDDQII